MIVCVLRNDSINENNNHKSDRYDAMSDEAKCIEGWNKRYTHEINSHENWAKCKVSENLFCPV